jgi:hypothetical protein
METTEILQALPHLTIDDRIQIAEAALKLIQQDQQLLTLEQRRQQMAIAASTAISDYSSDHELTAFTDLDGEDFYDTSGES